MSWRRALDAALDARGGVPGEVVVEVGDVRAEVDVRAVDRIGVAVRGVRVSRPEREVLAEADRLARDVRSLGERLRVVEASAGLGGVLRSREEEVHEASFHELRVEPGSVELTRSRRTPEGREAVDWEATREQIGRLLGELGG